MGRIYSDQFNRGFSLCKACHFLFKKTQRDDCQYCLYCSLQSEPHDAPFSASKRGIVAFTHALGITLGPDIRANCISPGWIETEKEKLKKKDHLQHPVGRGPKRDDIAHMVSFLISEKTGLITGQNFIVDGGMSVK